MVELEGFKLEIVPCPIVREADGLAMSSRNVRLTPEQREIAPLIHQTLVDNASLSLHGLDLDFYANVNSFLHGTFNIEVPYTCYKDKINCLCINKETTIKIRMYYFVA